MEDKKPILDYESPRPPKTEAELEAAQKEFDKHRENVENYSEATFGDRSPTKRLLIESAIGLVIIIGSCYLFPGRQNPIPYLITGVYFVIVRWLRDRI